MAKRVFTDESLEQLVSEIKNSATTSLDSAKSYTDSKVEDLASTSAVDTKISNHNTATAAHSDIRALIAELSTKLNQFLDVDDTTTDQLSEVLTLIENNKGTLESLTTTKVNVSDIVDNLTTSVETKVLSAKQGVAIKALIDALDTELAEHGHEIADVAGLQDALDGKAASSHGTHVTYSETAPVMDGTASVGSASSVARSDHKHPTDTSRAAQSDLDALEAEVAKKALATDLTAHTDNTSNPHSVTKAQVGLGNVDNTSDADKPVSTAQAAEIAKAQTKADEAYALAGTKADAGHIHAAEAVTYDNTTSGLTATDVQDAIDEIVANTESVVNAPFTLFASAWVDKTQTVAIDGVNLDTNGILFMRADATPEQEDAVIEADMSFTQADGSMTFVCEGNVPTIDIPLQITMGTIVSNINVGGSGDMASSVYDPQSKQTDIFAYIDDALVNYDSLPKGTEGQLITYDVDGNAIVRDMLTHEEVGAKSVAWQPTQTEVIVSAATDYTANRVRGMAIYGNTVPSNIPNGCFVGIYEIS